MSEEAAESSRAEESSTPVPATGDASPQANAGTTSRASAWGVAIGVLAMSIALAALLGTGFLWWQYRQFYLALDAADTATEESLQRLRAEQRAASDSHTELAQALTALRNRDDALSARLEAIPARLIELERSLSTLQGVSFDARREWLRAEASYYLTAANTELALRDRWDTAIQALELADGRLREIGDPSFGPVREQIADELLALRAVRLPDTQGLAYSLARLASRVPELPLAGGPASDYSASGSVPDEEPGLARLWATIKAALSTLISVQRQDAPVAHALSAADRALIQRQLAVELQLARIAVLAADEVSFRQSLETAHGLLVRHFDVTAAPVEGALELLTGMRELEIAPAKPDIGGSLRLLGTISAGGR